MAKKEILEIGIIAKAVQEQFTGTVNDKIIRFPKELGAEHPFNFEQVEGLYKKFGFVTGAVDKYVDNIIDTFEAKVKNANAQALIDKFLIDTDFKVVLRAWVREALLKGNGFMELDLKNSQIRVLNANNMYVMRDKYGNVISYNQYRGMDLNTFKVNQMQNFKPNQIAHLRLNVTADEPYGIGIVWPNIEEVNRLILNMKDLQDLIHRKAGQPIHARVGIPGQPTNPAKVQQFAADLQTLNNRTEWTTDANVEMKVIDFGNIGDKFANILMKNLELLYAGFQIPEVLMGSGQLNEGIAKVQLEGFQRRIKALQDEVEKVIEDNIFKPLLASQNNKQFNEHVDITWALPGETEINNRIAEISKLLAIMTLSNNMRRMLEIELAQLLNIEDYDKFLEVPEIGLDAVPDNPVQNPGQTGPNSPEAKKEAEIQQPEVPGAKPNANQSMLTDVIIHDNIAKDTCHCCKLSERLDSGEITVKEWINLQETHGFKYSDYVAEIIRILKKDEFKDLHAITEQDLQLGLLSDLEVDKLRTILKSGFKENWTIKKIEEEINSNIDLKDRKAIVEGKEEVQIGAEYRANSISRTETVRLANEGLISHYKNYDVKEVRWLAAISDRTCDECDAMNGTVYEIDNPPEIPLHPNCRCTTIPVLESDYYAEKHKSK